MKIKKISAIILAGALLASAVGMNAFADSTSTKPTITVFGNESSPAKPGETVELNVRLSNFNTIKGMDLELTLDNANKVKLTNATGKIGDNDLVNGTNYTVSDGKIHIVELNADNETINFKVTASVDKAATVGEYKVNVSKSDLALDGSSLATDKDSVGGNIVVATTNATSDKKENKKADEGYFIPYGSVYDSANNYIDKNADGSFNLTNGATYQQFKLPTAAKGLTTFGGSKPNDATVAAVQFGTYANALTNKKFGTLIIKGDWKKFLNSNIESKGYNADELLSKLYVGYVNGMKAAKDAGKTSVTNIKFTAPDGTAINVFNIPQTKYMWKDDGTILEFAARMTKVTSGTTYTGVGYSYETDNSPVFSTEINTYDYN